MAAAVASAVERKRAGAVGNLRSRFCSGSGSCSDTAVREKVGTNALFTVPLVAKKGGWAFVVVRTTILAVVGAGVVARLLLSDASIVAVAVEFCLVFFFLFLVDGTLWYVGLDLHLIFEHSQGLSRTKFLCANDDSSPLKRLLTLRNPHRLSFRTKLFSKAPRKYLARISLENRCLSTIRNEKPSGSQ